MSTIETGRAVQTSPGVEVLNTADVEPMPCPVCGMFRVDGPEGANWHVDWHCWKCGWDPAVAMTTPSLAAASAMAPQINMQALAAAVVDAMKAEVEADRAAVDAPKTVDELDQLRSDAAAERERKARDDEMAALRAELEQLRTAPVDTGAGAPTGGGGPAGDVPAGDATAIADAHLTEQP